MAGATVSVASAARNRAIGHLRTKRRELVLQQRAGREDLSSRHRAERVASGIERAEARDLAEALSRALDELSPRCQEVFLLSRNRGLPIAEIGAMLGISPKTVEIHMTRALSALRQKLAPWLVT